MQQDANKTNTQLSDELRSLRQRNTELEAIVSNLKETNEILKENEERSRAITDYGCDWENWIGPDGKLMWANPAVEKFTGYSVEEYLNMPDRLNQIIWEGDRDRIRSHFESGLRKRQSENDIEFQIRRKDGSLNWVSVSYQPMYTETGKCLGMRSSIRDISKRKLAEQALQESEEHFRRAIAEASVDAIYTVDQNGTIIFWNKAATKVFGYEENEALGRSNTMLLPKRFKESDSKARKQLLNTGVYSFKGKLNESVAVRKDGTEFPVEISISDWKVNDRQYFTAILRDITERKQQEAGLREREERFRTIAESSFDAIITSDSNGKILYWNKGAERIYGYTAEEIVGKSLEVLEPSAMRPIYRKRRGSLLKEGLSCYVGRTAEGIGIRKDGSEVPIEFSSSHWKIGGQIIFGGIARDITERKRMEEQLRNSHAELEKKVAQRTAELKVANEKLQMSEEYLKNFAGMLLSAREEERKNIATTIHDELGSMAIAVDSQISIAREECNENNKQNTFKALTNAQAALRKAVVDLRRVAVDLRPPNLEIMGLNAALTDLIDKVKQQAKFKIILRNELGTKKIPEDRAITIYRVIQEALTNITKHAKAKTVRIRLYADTRDIRLDIADDGTGCDLDKVLYRKGKPKIGIAGMRERVESLGGKFIITSAPKQGTQLKTTLPL